LSRRFRGLKHDPDKSYDAIIIGAGVGGLVCANLLVRTGLRVLLVEQHFMVGGYCSTFRRKGYTFDAATHFYPLLGNPASITGALLAELGVETEWIKMDPVDHFHFPDGSHFSVPADFQSYLAKLKLEFADEAGAIDDFFAFVRKAYLLGLVHYFREAETDRIAPFRDLTIGQVLAQHFRSPKLRLLLTGDIGHWGSPPSRTSFVFDSMLRLAYFLGNYYPRGGSQRFVDELAGRFEDMGGHILMSSLVRRILVNHGRADGVEIETGPAKQRFLIQVNAKAVISNADLIRTLEDMIGPDLLGTEYLAGIKKLRPTHPCFLVHLGLKNVTTEELRRIEGYYWSCWDAEQVATSAFKIFVPTLFDPGIAPPGGQIIIVQKLTDVDYGNIADWPSHKAAVDEYIAGNLERILPGILANTVVKLSASAHTSHRYTLNHQGAMLGWQLSPDQLGEKRPDIRGPIDNLFFVGHWSRPGGGITPVMISAMRTARLITDGQLTRDTLPAGSADPKDIEVASA
jgi:phytoene dehydrogenase-like protein